jgi:dolichol-phosphate mannosyltransferase
LTQPNHPDQTTNVAVSDVRQLDTTAIEPKTPLFELSIIIPTFNEADNIAPLLRRIARVLTERQIPCEVLVVDDGSPDGTAAVARQVNLPIVLRVIERTGERGLSQSVVDGIEAARGACVLVMDADLQHPPEAIPAMLNAVRQGCDFAIGSRYVEGGESNEFGWCRKLNSKVATWLCVPLVGRRVRDPMAGFFCLRRDRVDVTALNPIGYKIGLELLVKCRPASVTEIPIEFGSRHAGESKLNLAEQLNYLRHLRRLYGWRWSGVSQAVLFCLVGACGMVVDLTLMAILIGVGLAFPFARLASIGTAMVSNFFLNRLVTFPEANRRGWKGQLARFVGACSIGLVINWSVSNALYVLLPAWRSAYQLFCIAGIAAATANNFLLSKYLVFRKKGTPAEAD